MRLTTEQKKPPLHPAANTGLADAKIGPRVVDPKLTDPPGETLPCE